MIGQNEAKTLFQLDNLIEIGMMADEARRHIHSGAVVSYVLETTIRYTNVCQETSQFSAGFRPVGHADGYLLDAPAVCERIQEAIDFGATGILLEGGIHPELKLEWYEDLLKGIRKRFDIDCRGFSASEIVYIAQTSGRGLRETIERLRSAGLESIAGGGAQILDDGVRARMGCTQCSSAQWLDVHRTAHRMGMRTSATMVLGLGESIEQRVAHLDLLRTLQEESGGFTAFTPTVYERPNTPFGRSVKEEASAVEYLKTLAISRIYLENFVNVEASWARLGLKTCQVALRFGGNDVGGLQTGRSGSSGPVAHHETKEEDLRRLIRDAGFSPRRRDTSYSQYFLN